MFENISHGLFHKKVLDIDPVTVNFLKICLKIRIYCWYSHTKFWDRDSYFLFHDLFPITVTEAVYSLEKAEKMENLSVTVIALKFLIFLISVTAVTLKSVRGRQFYHLPKITSQSVKALFMSQFSSQRHSIVKFCQVEVDNSSKSHQLNVTFEYYCNLLVYVCTFVRADFFEFAEEIPRCSACICMDVHLYGFSRAQPYWLSIFVKNVNCNVQFVII